MALNLTPSQQEALEINCNILVEAGAGSGKTTVFIQRFITLLSENKSLNIDQILGITFTNLAASELLLKLQDTLIQEKHPALHDTAFKDSLLQQLHLASFMTIHGLCAKICKAFSYYGDIDPDFTICNDIQTSTFIDNAISTTTTALANEKHPSLKALLLVYAPSQLHSLLTQLLTQRLSTLDHAEQYLSSELTQFIENPNETTQIAYTRLKHLLTIFQACHTTFQALKKEENMLDYDDLILVTLQILEHQHCLHTLQKQYAYIMVDEFQDTDRHQWTIIQRLCDDFNPLNHQKLFLVGDVKQSIYSFRHADPSIFLSVMNTFDTSTYTTKVVHMSENFRSQGNVIQFINQLFSTLFQESELPIPYTPLRPQLPETQAVSLGLFSDYTSFRDEATFIARWIHHILEGSDLTLNDIAIITRRKTHFDTLKTILESYQLPVMVETQINFFRRDHILDMIHLIETMIDKHHSLALYSLLKSPLYAISEEHLFHLNQTHQTQTVYQQLTGLRTERTTTHALDILEQTLRLSTTHSLAQSVRYFYDHITLPDTYSLLDREDINTLLALLSEWEELFHFDRFNLLNHLYYCIDTNYTPPRQTASAEGIQLLTIHASKGLEFPVVILPELHQAFNFSKQASLIITPKGIGLSASDLTDKNQLRTDILEDQETRIIDEERRLFYVACTRAKSYLLLTGNGTPKKETPSYLSFLNQHLSSNSPQGYIHYDSIQDIPFKPYKKQSSPHEITPSSPLPELPRHTDSDYHLSVSQIEALLRCSKHFWYDTTLQLLNTTEKDAIEKGIVMHYALERLFKQPTQSIPSLIHQACVDAQLPQDSYQEYVQTHLDRIKKSTLFNTIQTHVFLTEKGFSWKYGSLIIDGRFDLIYFENKTAHVIDFKTGRHKPITYFYTQMMIYILALSELYPDYEIKASVYFVEHDSLETLSWNTESLHAFEATLTNIPNLIQTKSFTAPDMSICDSCPLFQHNAQCREMPI